MDGHRTGAGDDIRTGGEMTDGQIAQLQELSKCRMKRPDKVWINFLMFNWEANQLAIDKSYRFDGDDKRILRRLTYQYRNQIAAMRKNRERVVR